MDDGNGLARTVLIPNSNRAICKKNLSPQIAVCIGGPNTFHFLRSWTDMLYFQSIVPKPNLIKSINFMLLRAKLVTIENETDIEKMQCHRFNILFYGLLNINSWYFYSLRHVMCAALQSVNH